MEDKKNELQQVMASKIEQWDGKKPIAVINVSHEGQETTVTFNGAMKNVHMKAAAICMISYLSAEEQAAALIELMRYCCEQHPEIQEMIDTLTKE